MGCGGSKSGMDAGPTFTNVAAGSAVSADLGAVSAEAAPKPIGGLEKPPERKGSADGGTLSRARSMLPSPRGSTRRSSEPAAELNPGSGRRLIEAAIAKDEAAMAAILAEAAGADLDWAAPVDWVPPAAWKVPGRVCAGSNFAAHEPLK